MAKRPLLEVVGEKEKEQEKLNEKKESKSKDEE